MKKLTQVCDSLIALLVGVVLVVFAFLSEVLGLALNLFFTILLVALCICALPLVIVFLPLGILLVALTKLKLS